MVIYCIEIFFFLGEVVISVSLQRGFKFSKGMVRLCGLFIHLR